MSISLDSGESGSGSAAAPPARARGRGAPAALLPDRWALLLLPGTVFLAVFFAYPTVVLLGRTFSDFVAPEVGGLDNLRWFFQEPANVAVLERTVLTALAVTALTAVLGLPYAYLMTLVGRRMRLFLLGVAVASFLGSLLVRSVSWLIIFQRNGPLNDLLGAIGLGPAELSGSSTAVVIAMTQILVPLTILSVYATLQGVDRRLVQAAESLGARRSTCFARVVLPLSLPGVVGGGFMVFVLTLGFYVTPTLVGSTQTALLSSFTVTQVQRLAAFGRAGAIAIVLLALMLAFLVLVTIVVRRRVDPGPQQAAGADVEERWGAGRKLAWTAFAVAMTAWLILPSLLVIPLSLTERTSIVWPPSGLSLRWYENLFSDPGWTSAIWNTVQVGALTVLASLVLGTAAALAIVRSNTRWVGALAAVFYAPTIVPLVVTGVGIYTVFLEWKLVGSLFGFVAAHTVAALPFVVIVMLSSVRSVDRRLEDAASSLGAGTFDTFRSVTLPAIRPGLLTAAFIAFAFSFDETVFSLFIATPDLQTLPTQTFQGVNRATDPTVLAASTLTFVVTLAGLGLALLAQRKDPRVSLI